LFVSSEGRSKEIWGEKAQIPPFGCSRKEEGKKNEHVDPQKLFPPTIVRKAFFKNKKEVAWSYNLKL
jgi:hypothetical protein